MIRTVCDSKWRAESAKARSALRMPDAYRPWTSLPRSHSPVCERVRDVIDVAFTKARSASPSASIDELVAGLVVNVSSTATRAKACSIDQLPPFKADTLLYNYGTGDLHSPAMCMQIFGWPRDQIVGSARTVQELGEHAKSVPVCTLLAVGLLLNPHAPWWSTGTFF